MTKTIVLSLALTVGSLVLAAPPALACGGYARVDPTKLAVRDAASAYVSSELGTRAPFLVYRAEVRGERASAVVRIQLRTGPVERDLRLVRRAMRWTVVGVSPRRAIG